MLLSEFDISYVTQKAIKGSALAEFLAHQPINDYHPMQPEFPDEKSTYDERKWTLFFDGSSNALGHGIGAVLIFPKK